MTSAPAPDERSAPSWAGLRAGANRRASAALTALLLALGAAACRRGGGLPPERAARLTGGNPAHGAELIRGFGCGACHVIPGIAGAQGEVGPPLAGLVRRAYIGGVLSNTSANLVRWIVNPRAVDPLTAMPTLGLSDGEARDVAAYLYTR
ncbi:MAG: c-type cytochrome [Gemmatimonadales bacterium]|jgi:cytochrome c2